jgi:hypothetical protein
MLLVGGDSKDYAVQEKNNNHQHARQEDKYPGGPINWATMKCGDESA